jgi:two-component system LytT family sensor kinase
MARLNWTRIAYHALFWTVYVPLNAALACLVQGLSVYDYFLSGVTSELILVPVKMLFVYYIFYFVIPLFLERSKVLTLISTSLLGFIVTAILYRCVDTFIYLPIFHPEITAAVFDPINIALASFDIFITASAATTIKMIRVHYASMDYEKELIREKLSSELDFLRAQTNPHFLFNTLNNLYGLARKKSEKTPDAVLMLSKIMRFMLYDCRSPRIPVSGESKVIRDYIELEKLRYNDRLTVHFEENLDAPSALIAPLLLLPFVENSFKHGAHSSTDAAEIKVRLTLKNNQLDFSVENTFDEEEGFKKDLSASGIGLRNERRQLELLYPGCHELTISDENGWYKAHLQINLAQDN